MCWMQDDDDAQHVFLERCGSVVCHICLKPKANSDHVNSGFVERFRDLLMSAIDEAQT